MTEPKRYTNHENIPLAIAVFLATDNYDHEDDTISATTLLKPVRQIVLADRVEQSERVEDISALVPSRLGSAIHDAIERSWTTPKLTETLKSLGYPKRVIDQIRVNPKEDDEDGINIYLEQRAYKKVGKYTISGKFDFIGDGYVQDFKRTSVWTYLNQSNSKKYVQQGSIYRWLNPDIITQNHLWIHYIFSDWSKAQTRQSPDYPKSSLHSQAYELMSIPATEAFVKSKLKLIETYKDAPEETIPECTDEDLWRKPTVWKFYIDPNKQTRSTKNFDSFHEAQKYFVERGSKGIIVEHKGTVSACLYCPVFSVCTQKDRLIASGELILPTS